MFGPESSVSLKRSTRRGAPTPSKAAQNAPDKSLFNHRAAAQVESLPPAAEPIGVSGRGTVLLASTKEETPVALHIEDLAYLREVQTFARESGKARELAEHLRTLGHFFDLDRSGRTRTRLFRDRAPWSFRFVVERTHNGTAHCLLDGALVYHGAHDGYGSGAAPAFAVTLEPTAGWSVHT